MQQSSCASCASRASRASPMFHHIFCCRLKKEEMVPDGIFAKASSLTLAIPIGWYSTLVRKYSRMKLEKVIDDHPTHPPPPFPLSDILEYLYEVLHFAVIVIQEGYLIRSKPRYTNETCLHVHFLTKPSIPTYLRKVDRGNVDPVYYCTICICTSTSCWTN